VLAAAGALLPADSGLAVRVADLHHGGRGLGALLATLRRNQATLEFALESAPGAADSPHEISASGSCTTRQVQCQLEFNVDTRRLAALLAVEQLPPEWPTQSLQASGVLAWRGDEAAELPRVLTGRFEIESQGAQPQHQLTANATMAGGQIELTEVQGTGPEPDQVFRGSGRVGLLARSYDLTVDYERVALAATGVPSPAGAGFARAWSALRGSAARRGWTEAPPARRVQWHGTWSAEP
jgi:hypothetical protein